MKTLLNLLLVTCCIVFIAAIQDSSTPDNAKADQVEGYYIFLMSKPVKAYDYLGSVNVGATMFGNPQEKFNSLIKRTKKDYPKADAIIFHDIEMKKVDAIKFK